MKFISSIEEILCFLEKNGSDQKSARKGLRKLKDNNLNKLLQYERKLARAFFTAIKSHLNQYFNGEDKMSFLETEDVQFSEKGININLSKEFRKLKDGKEEFDGLLYNTIYAAVVNTLSADTDEKLQRLRSALIQADPQGGSSIQLSEVVRSFKSVAEKYKGKFDPKADTRTNLKTVLKAAADDDEMLDLIQEYTSKGGEMASTFNPGDLLSDFGIGDKDFSDIEGLKDRFGPKMMEKLGKMDPNLIKELGM